MGRCKESGSGDVLSVDSRPNVVIDEFCFDGWFKWWCIVLVLGVGVVKTLYVYTCVARLFTVT